MRCLVENLYKVTYKFRISGIVTTLFISRKVLQTRPQFCFAAILLFCIFAENKRFSYAKTGIDYGSHFGHRTRHGAPAGKGGIRRHRHGPPGRPARDAARGDRSGGRPLHDARLRRALRGGGAPQPLSARKHRPAGQQRGSRRRTGAHRPGRHARLGRHDRHQRQGASLRHARHRAQDGRRGPRAHLQHRLDRRDRGLRERRGLLRLETRRARHFAVDARRPTFGRDQGDGDPPGNGRDRIFRSAFPRRQEAR